MHYVLFTGGDFTSSKLTEKAIKKADKIIAADSGADTALYYGIYPTAVLGDLDSITLQTKRVLEKHQTAFISSPREKDETDTELAIDYAIENGATEITIFGGSVGDRFDHIIANLFLITKYTIPITFLNGHQIFWVAKGPTTQTILGKKNDLLSLIPLKGDSKNITTTNLYYPLTNGVLTFGKPRGVSNVFTKDTATVSFSEGTLLFVHTTQT